MRVFLSTEFFYNFFFSYCYTFILKVSLHPKPILLFLVDTEELNLLLPPPSHCGNCVGTMWCHAETEFLNGTTNPSGLVAWESTKLLEPRDVLGKSCHQIVQEVKKTISQTPPNSQISVLGREP